MPSRDRMLAVLVTVLWGLNFTAIHLSLAQFPPYFLVALRFPLIAGPTLLFVRRPAVPLRWLVGYGVGFGVLQFVFLYAAPDAALRAATGRAVAMAGGLRRRFRGPAVRLPVRRHGHRDAPRPDVAGPAVLGSLHRRPRRCAAPGTAQPSPGTGGADRRLRTGRHRGAPCRHRRRGDARPGAPHPLRRARLGLPAPLQSAAPGGRPAPACA